MIVLLILSRPGNFGSPASFNFVLASPYMLLLEFTRYMEFMVCFIDGISCATDIHPMDPGQLL